MTNPSKILFDDYITEILKIVNDKPGIKRSEVYSLLGTTSTKPREMITKMIEIGYITEERGQYFNIKKLELTEEGERILKLIKKIESGEEDAENYPSYEKIRNMI